MPSKIIQCKKHGEVIVDDEWGDSCPICFTESYYSLEG